MTVIRDEAPEFYENAENFSLRCAKCDAILLHWHLNVGDDNAYCCNCTPGGAKHRDQK